jgi:periplasmic protein TonB
MNAPKRSPILLSSLALGSGVITLSLALHAALLTVARAYNVPISAETLSLGDRIGALAIQIESAPAMPVGPPRSECPPSPRETALPELWREAPARRSTFKPPSAATAQPTAAASAPPTADLPSGHAPVAAQLSQGPGPALVASEAAWDQSAAETSTGNGHAAGRHSLGSSSPANSAGLGSVSDAAWMEQYGRAVHAKIAAAVVFPERAARENRQGALVLRVVLNSDGRLLEATVVGGEVDPVLRDAALTAVRRASPFPAPPRPVGAPAVPVSFRIPVRFYLRGG